MKINLNWKYQESPGPEVSAYTTTWNCVNGGYPIESSIESFLWVDKIVVVDGGSTDGTREILSKLQEKHSKIEVVDLPINLDMPGKDGYQKSMALAMCSTPFAIQFDIDEICVGDQSKWRLLVKEMPNSVDILSLPVIEPFGNPTRIRFNQEHTPWKWRIFRTRPEITHGIPKQDQVIVGDKTYSKGGSDGCFPIHIITQQMYPHKLTSTAKRMLEVKNSRDKDEYKKLLNELRSSKEPAILHLGHVDLHKKIAHYLKSWHTWWCDLYNKDADDPKNNLYFPGVAVGDVTDEMISQKVLSLTQNTDFVSLD
jgi:glycosyltransferase involved in cell wall biosynthesis